METTSRQDAPLALQKTAAELLTLQGMANHLVLLATASPDTRTVAYRWFGELPTEIQVDLIKSVGRDANAAAQLVMLVPDAGLLMPHLGIGIVRRVCDSYPTLLTAMPARRLATMVRITKHPVAKLEWLAIITEWCDEQVGPMEAFIDELDPIELADWLSSVFRIRHIALLRHAMDDPMELEDCLGDTFPFVRLLFTCRYAAYQTVIGEIILRLADRWEHQSRDRSIEELQREHWPALTRYIKQQGS